MEKQRNYNEEGLRLRNLKKYLLYKQKLKELKEYQKEEEYEFQLKQNQRKR